MRKLSSDGSVGTELTTEELEAIEALASASAVEPERDRVKELRAKLQEAIDEDEDEALLCVLFFFLSFT